MPDRVKFAARSWAQSRLHPGTLQVTAVSVATDERRARADLTADGHTYHLRLVRPGDEWHVDHARRDH